MKNETEEIPKSAESSTQAALSEEDDEPVSLMVLTSKAPVTYSRKRKTETYLSIVNEADEDDPIFHKSPQKKVKPGKAKFVQTLGVRIQNTFSIQIFENRSDGKWFVIPMPFKIQMKNLRIKMAAILYILFKFQITEMFGTVTI